MALSKIDADGVSGLQATLTAATTVPSEGGAVTTNLVQGLAKAWVNFNGTGTIAARDSFNLSGLTDNGTGNYTTSFISVMNNANYTAVATCGLDSGGSRAFCSTDSHATTSVAVLLRQAASNSNIDAADVQPALLGDLA